MKHFSKDCKNTNIMQLMKATNFTKTALKQRELVRSYH